MTTAHGADRAVWRAAFWDGFWETFASPFALVLNGFAFSDDDETPKEIANRHLARCGLPPLELHSNAGSIDRAAQNVSDMAWRVFARMEQEDDAQAKIDRTARP